VTERPPDLPGPPGEPGPVASPAWRMVAESLRRKIGQGQYRPGDLLPSERQLADSMGVSRITVREALRVLQAERLIDARRGTAGGAQVRAPRSRPVEEARDEVRRERSRLLHILDCRIANESLAVRLACAMRTDEHLQTLEETMAATAAASQSLDERLTTPGVASEDLQAAVGEFRNQDSVFHLTIAAIPTNPYLYRTIEWLRSELFTPLDLIRTRQNRQDSTGEHRAILDAIRDRDEAAATEAMCHHIESTKRSMERLLERR
jgi:GntR family transcriptional regulator, transcriptional repressor for pyruvate dehydrogenase complex